MRTLEDGEEVARLRAAGVPMHPATEAELGGMLEAASRSYTEGRSESLEVVAERFGVDKAS